MFYTRKWRLTKEDANGNFGRIPEYAQSVIGDIVRGGIISSKVAILKTSRTILVRPQKERFLHQCIFGRGGHSGFISGTVMQEGIIGGKSISVSEGACGKEEVKSRASGPKKRFTTFLQAIILEAVHETNNPLLILSSEKQFMCPSGHFHGYHNYYLVCSNFKEISICFPLKKLELKIDQ